jgi:heme/copper-type cytochrome/quinol oxidase subunit 2
MSSRPRRPAPAALLLIALLCAAPAARTSLGAWLEPRPSARTPQDASQIGETREFHVVARKYSYSQPRIEVRQNDIVKMTFETADIPHSFTIDEPYRIAKRTAPGHPVVFEFRADKVGTFDFYCNLKTDDGCQKMRGQLVVTAR